VKRTLTIVTLTVLANCGGTTCYPTGCGDIGGFTSPTNLSSAPGEAALVAYLKSGHQQTLGATDTSGNSYSIQLTSIPNPASTTFNGSAPAYSTVDTLNLNANGVLIAHSVSTSYFLLNPYVPLGKAFNMDTPYALVTSSVPFPTTLQVGTSGSVDTMTYYHDSSLGQVDANAATTYAVKANDVITLLLCLDTVIADVTPQGTADGLVDGTESDCYTVDAAGNAVLISITTPVNGMVLQFK